MPSLDLRRLQKSTNRSTQKISGPLIGVIILAILLLAVLLIILHLWWQRKRKMKGQSSQGLSDRTHDGFIIQGQEQLEVRESTYHT
ncbi:hypothetical protein BJX66DRAFT_318527, partial [Aspergillus keveii]